MQEIKSRAFKDGVIVVGGAIPVKQEQLFSSILVEIQVEQVDLKKKLKSSEGLAVLFSD